MPRIFNYIISAIICLLSACATPTSSTDFVKEKTSIKSSAEIQPIKNVLVFLEVSGVARDVVKMGSNLENLKAIANFQKAFQSKFSENQIPNIIITADEVRRIYTAQTGQPAPPLSLDFLLKNLAQKDKSFVYFSASNYAEEVNKNSKNYLNPTFWSPTEWKLILFTPEEVTKQNSSLGNSANLKWPALYSQCGQDFYEACANQAASKLIAYLREEKLISKP